MTRIAAPALRALLEGFIDYAGLFPPAKVELDQALANYEEYGHSDHRWMLRWFVVSGKELEKVPAQYDGTLSILAEADQNRAAAIESNSPVQSARPVYCEVAVNNLAALDAVKEAHNYAKIRTGGLKAEAIPSPAAVANFITACAERKLPFKATAGLHHPIRAEQALTYDANAERAVMHGFINVLLAAAFAWHGERQIEPIIAETDASAFSFDERAHWREKSLSLAEINDARRNFIHAVGSCSFTEPVQDLQSLGLL